MISSASFALEFNNREYVQFTETCDTWFEVYQGDTFRVVGTEIFVYFDPTATPAQIAALNSNLEGEIIETFEDGPVVIQSTDDPLPDPLDFMESYLNAAIVDGGSNNTYGFYCWPDDPAVNDMNSPYLQRFLVEAVEDPFNNSINPSPAWDLGVGTREVKVGVLDGGILVTHPDLAGNIWQNFGEDVNQDDILKEQNGVWWIDGNDVNEVDDDDNLLVDDLMGWNTTSVGANPLGGPHAVGDGNASFECGHGTLVAGVIAAMNNNGFQFASIAGGDWSDPENPLNPVKIVVAKMHGGLLPQDPLWFDNREVLRGLIYLRNYAHVNVINMSFRTTETPAINAQLVAAANDGILLFGAAGRFEGEMFYPAIHDSVMAIGLSVDDERNVRSAIDPKITVLAPGNRTDIGQEDPYVVYTTGAYEAMLDLEVGADPGANEQQLLACRDGGVSMAVPQVSGVASLLLSHAQTPDNLILTRADVSEIICVTASRSGDAPYILDGTHPYGAYDEDEEMGYGELDMGNAVLYGKRHDISFVSGWRMISSRIEPFHNQNNLLKDENGILLSWKEVPDASITLLKNQQDDSWDGAQDPMACGIAEWNPLYGYKVNMSAASNLVMLGKPIPIDTEIQLSAGWHWVSYLPDVTLEVDEAFASLNVDENLNIVKNGLGQFWIPSSAYNGIPDCDPGEGFEISLDEAAILNYSDQQASPKRPNIETPPQIASEPDHFNATSITDYFHPLVITELSVDNLEIQNGDEIGIWTARGICIGAGVYAGQLPMGIALWRDDPTTEAIDGYTNGDLFLLKYWNSATDQEFGPDTLDIFGGLDAAPSQIFTSAKISFGKPNVIVPTSFVVSQPYPNPFNMSTSIRFELPDAGKLQITIHDASGRLVNQSEIAQPRAGYLTWTWNGNDLQDIPVTSGTYFCKIDYIAQSGDQKSVTSKFTALR